MHKSVFTLIFVLGCATRQYTPQNSVFNNADILYPIDSIIFQNPIRDFYVHNNQSIFILDNGLEKIFKVDLNNSARIETISLSQKPYFIKSLVVDNFYIYLYGDNELYRYDQSSENLTGIIRTNDRVKISSLSTTSEGEIFISDGLNYKILLVNSLGQITEFRRPIKDLFIPACIYYDNFASRLWVINHPL